MTLQTGDAAPDFNLPNANASVGGEHVSLADAAGANGTVESLAQLDAAIAAAKAFTWK